MHRAAYYLHDDAGIMMMSLSHDFDSSPSFSLSLTFPGRPGALGGLFSSRTNSSTSEVERYSYLHQHKTQCNHTPLLIMWWIPVHDYNNSLICLCQCHADDHCLKIWREKFFLLKISNGFSLSKCPPTCKVWVPWKPLYQGHLVLPLNKLLKLLPLKNFKCSQGVPY